jgi:DNA-directed RNA polymerase specialized sigma24 family protein
MARTTSLTRDRDYATFVEDRRALLQRCAYLLVGRRDAADQLVQATLADLYARWRHVRDPLLVALRLLYTTDLGDLPSWTPRARFELLDARKAAVEPVDPMVTLLGGLSARQRMVVVLEWVARVPRVEVAAVLDSSVETVDDVARDARTALVRSAPELADDAALVARLDAAVPPDVRVVRRYDDLRHGQELARRRWLRRTGIVAAALVLLVLVASQLRPVAQSPVSAPAPTAPAPTPTVTVTPSPTAPCDRTVVTCQASVARAWRATVYEVVANYLDPEGAYFNASSYYARDETEGLWRTKQGALAMEIFRVGGGSTEVYVQIATSRAYAPRCGEATGNVCSSIRFLDGNRFILSDGLDTNDGLEGQYRPDGDDVITVIVRDVGPGEPKLVDRGQLVRMLQDERLRLPAL